MTQEQKEAIVKKQLVKDLDAEADGAENGAITEMGHLINRDETMQSVAAKLGEEHQMKRIKFGDLTLEWESKTEKKNE